MARLVTGAPLAIPVTVVHGRRDGPTIWLSAAIHGDEVNGVEIIRRVLERLDARTMAGTLLAVPILNVPGFMTGDRYLPDRRDLNRSFPGSERGSLGARIANIFMTQVVNRCSIGIDLHTGSAHRTNLPQVRGDLDDPETYRLAAAFGAPLMLHAAIRDGSLRQAGTERGVTVLLYEGGEAWRFDEAAIGCGVEGVLRVLEAVGVIASSGLDPAAARTSVEARSTRWVRARRSGLALIEVEPGESVAKGQNIGRIHDTTGHRLSRINAPFDGIVIGRSLDPIVHQGDALVHIAQTRTITPPSPTFDSTSRSTTVLGRPAHLPEVPS